MLYGYIGASGLRERIRGEKAKKRREMGVSENKGPEYSTLNSRILITKTPE